MTKNKLKLNGIEIDFHEYSNSNKETILFLHCSGGNKHQWDSIIPYFENDFHLVIPDLRGHGESEKPETGFTLNLMMEDIKAFLDYKNLKHVRIIGSSLGSEIAVALASKYPTYVKSIVAEGAIINNFGPLGYYGDLTKNDIDAKKNEILDKRIKVEDPVFETEELMIQAYQDYYEENGLAFNNYRKKYVLANIRKDLKGNFYTKQCPTRVGYELIRDYLDLYFETFFKNVICPVLFLPSEEEMKEPCVNSALNVYKTLLNTWEVKIIKGSVHAETMFDQPKLLSDTIFDFYNNIL